MIEIICDNCGERIENIPKGARVNFSEKHTCENCIRGMIKEHAKKIADASLEHASYDLLTLINWNLEEALQTIDHISDPPHNCPVCGDILCLLPQNREYFCLRCGCSIDVYGNKIRDGREQNEIQNNI